MFRFPRAAFRPSEASIELVRAMRARPDLRGVRAVVIGAGKSGLAACALLEDKGATVSIADDRSAEQLSTEGRQFVDRLGLHRIEPGRLAEAELIVVSPGVPRARPELAAAIEKGLVVGEVELASWFISCPMVGITGTNGKSTTTALTAHLFEACGRRAFAGANLGEPASRLAMLSDPPDLAVLELSSYQLESLVSARFEVACWLNLTPDHTDRYPDFEHYAAAKLRLLECQTDTGIVVLNADDPTCVAAAEGLSRVVWFGEDSEGYDLDNPHLPGAHNRANMSAAIACVSYFSTDRAAIQRGLSSFGGLAHRLELVRELGGVRYINDSKSTNVDSTVIALRAIDGRKILIAGGRDKGASWEPAVRLAAKGVVAVLAIGEAASIVTQAFSGVVDVVESVGTLDRAVSRAHEIARSGDSVLLSPACASFDQFDNFERRGEAYKSLVRSLDMEALHG